MGGDFIVYKFSFDAYNSYINSKIMSTYKNILNALHESVNQDDLVEHNWHKNPDGTYSVDGSCSISPKQIGKDGKLLVKFSYVSGSFGFDKKAAQLLKSFEGCPEIVGGVFECMFSPAKTLKGCPKKVAKDFIILSNEIKNLEGAPEYVGGKFHVAFCTGLTSLKGSPKEVVGNFEAFGCYNLNSIEGAPKEVGGDFDIRGANIKSLDGLKTKVRGKILL